jgi:DUF971 family protein
MSDRPWPVEIRVRRTERALTISFDSGESFDIPASLLRVMTPAADARGHGTIPGELAPLAIDKSGVGLAEVTAIGRYAVRIAFDDGYDSGIYTWDALHRMGRDRAKLEAAHRASLLTPSGPR